MNKFNDPEIVESLCTQMRLANYPRSKNRALINNLFNGFPPWTDHEVLENNIEVNINDLTGVRLSHDARTQFYQSMLKPGNFFASTTDAGPKHKRQKWGVIVTKERNKIMKKSLPYIETLRSKIAMNVLHGIAPCSWRDDQMWRPYAIGIDDVFVPGNTLLTMENLPFFAIYRSLTAPEMIELTQAGKLDPAWDKDMLKASINWVDKQTQTLMYNNYPEIWSPEKTMERVKGAGGFYFGDQVPTINVFDFYFWNNSDRTTGWNRRMILDAWSMPVETQVGKINQKAPQPERRTEEYYKKYSRQFLYNPGDRKVALEREELINWQFADLSAVAPFRYHSVRSLGFLLYAVCHLQNRLRSKFNEAVFEQLMMYFRITSQDDMQRALKVDLVNRGFIDDSIKFIPPGERYQIDKALAELGLQQNEMLINRNSSSYTSNPQPQNGARDRTKFEVMADVSAMTTMVSAAQAQAYMYQLPEYREIARRFTIKDSKDPDVRKFQANCLRQGVSEKVLYCNECWEHEAEQVLGAGNKTMEMAIAQQLMEFRPLFDPEPQREILRRVTFAVTSDAALTDSLVPENPVQMTDTIYSAQLAVGTLMQGLPVGIKTGINHIEYVDTLLAELEMLINQYSSVNGHPNAQQSLPTPDKLNGMGSVLNNAQKHVQIIAQDKNEQQRVKQYQDVMGKMANALKAFAQQLNQQAQAKAAQGPQQDPETQAKVQAITLMAQTKAQNTSTAHAQRTAQRQLQFELDQQRRQQEFNAEIARENARTAHDLQLENVETGHGLHMEQARTASEIRLDHIRELNKPKKVDSGGNGD